MDVVGSTTTDVDSVNKVELVDCVVEIDVEEEGDIVVDRVVVDAIVVEVGSETEEIIDGNGATQILYSQLTVYGLASVKTNTCNKALAIKSNGGTKFQQLTLMNSCSDKGPLINTTSVPVEDETLYTKVKSSATIM